MAAIGRNILLAAFLSAPGAFPDQADDVLKVVNQIATALSGGNPADAIAPFDKSCSHYTSLRNDFIGLTDAYQLSNEANVTDEQDSINETTLTLQWALSLTDKSTGESSSRNAEVHVRLHGERGKWKVIEFSPVDFFDPAAKQ